MADGEPRQPGLFFIGLAAAWEVLLPARREGYEGGTSVLRRTLRESAGRVLTGLVRPSAWLWLFRLLKDCLAWTVHRLATAPGSLPAVFKEWRNKVTVFLLVPRASRLLGIVPSPDLDLKPALQQAEARDPFSGLWLLEGLVHDVVFSFFHQNKQPKGVLQGNLPEHMTTALHAGLGLALAQWAFEPCRRSDNDVLLESRLQLFLDLCRENAQAENINASLESLGVYIHVFRPFLLHRLDAVLAARTDRLRDYFWHGVGRGVYFAMQNAVPYSDRNQLAFIDRNAPDETGKQHALAGLAWTCVLVNHRHPAVIDRIWIQPHGERLSREPGFARGVACAAMMRAWISPDSGYNRALLDYRGGCYWSELVVQPIQLALESALPIIRSKGNLSAVLDHMTIGAYLHALV
ncbi:MAG: hypothetical protein QNK37_00085 [Acidobacteriota bacterium]|nr:hypothetical protein [Acidobacteriota bacterium]